MNPFLSCRTLAVFCLSIVITACGKPQADSHSSSQTTATLNDRAVLGLLADSPEFTEPREIIQLVYTPKIPQCRPSNSEYQIVQLGLAEVNKTVDALGDCQEGLTAEGKAILESPDVKMNKMYQGALLGYVYTVPITRKAPVSVLSITDGGLNFAYVEFTWMRVSASHLSDKIRQFNEKTPGSPIPMAQDMGIVNKGTAELWKSAKGWTLVSFDVHNQLDADNVRRRMTRHSKPSIAGPTDDGNAF